MEKSYGRLKLLALLVAFMFAALSTRLWFLQVLASERLKAEGSNNTVRIVETEAPRGRILDDKGRVIVDNRPSLVVTANLQQLGSDPEGELLRLSELLHVPVGLIRDRLASKIYYDYQPKPIAYDVNEKTAAFIKEHQDPGNNLFPGVDVIETAVRDYPNGDLAAHILGSTGLITKEEIKNPTYGSYGPNDTVGQSGLESTYERYLRGQKGTDKYVVNAAGQLLRILGTTPPVPGDDVKLNIDLKAQAIAEQALYDGIKHARTIPDTTTGRDLVANAGAVVVLDPQTFGVKAIASYPTFDPSWFEQTRLSKKQSRYVNSKRLSPLFDRAAEATLAPGSTFKPFVALSALNEGIASLGGTIECSGDYFYPTDPSHVFHNWSGVGVGYISIAKALQISCDTVFYRLGAAMYNKFDSRNPYGGTGPYERDLHSFGFGKPSGIDLPVAGAGLIPDPGWKAKFAKDHPDLFTQHDDIWLPGDEILMSIGQGYVQVTPLQLAAAYAAIANGGKLCDPRLAEGVQTAQGKRVDVHSIAAQHCQKLPFSTQEISYIRSALQAVTKPGGTAGLAFSGFPFSQVSVGGKTGTAQRPGFGAQQDTSWFAAIAGPPGGKAQYVVVVMVEQGGFGSTTAAPIARSIIEQLYGLQGAHGVKGGFSD